MQQSMFAAPVAPASFQVRVVWVSPIDRMARLGVGDTHYDVHEGQPAPVSGPLGLALVERLKVALQDAEEIERDRKKRMGQRNRRFVPRGVPVAQVEHQDGG